MSRKQPSLKTKLAAALLQMLRPNENGQLVPVIPYEDAKQMTADQIISVFHFDHGVLHAHDGPAEPWNLTPRPIKEHRIKTATIDAPRAAKADRLSEAQEDFRRRVLARAPGEPRKLSRKIPSRPFPKSQRLRDAR